MGMKKWQVAEFDKALAKELAEECDVDPIIALIASTRGYTDPAALEEFLSDEPYFEDPRALADIEKAAEIINSEIESGGKIAVFGDYDCDGVTATAIMYSYLSGRGADCIYYIPDRFDEGYGMNCEAVKKLKDGGVSLLITVDNGIACHSEIKLAKEIGMSVVVTDHHLPSDILPEADAVVDPHRADCSSEFKEICGAEVAFKLICVMEDKEPEELLPYFADLLSVAVTADVMPLTLENRAIVKYGVEKLKTAPATGLSAILNVAGISADSVNAGRIAFGISPRINAAGRMGSAKRAVELLLCDNMLKALGIAGEIDDANAERQRIEKEIFAQAVEIIEKKGYKYDRVIVVEGESWHNGVVGIVASRITERYGCPSVVISKNGEAASGSGRSIEGFSLYNAIKYASDTLIKFGGHELAAGVSLESENIELFRQKINEYAAEKEYVPPVLKLDCRLNPSALSLDLAEALKELEPFGHGNPTPLFGVYGVTLTRITPIGGGKHLRLLFSKGENSFQALLFGMTKERFCFCEGDLLDAAVTVDTNLYNGELSLSVQVKALRMSGTDDERLFREIDSLNSYMAGREYDVNLLLPSRVETGIIYKFISAAPATEERIKYVHLSTVGYAKTAISLMTLTELGLITKDSTGIYRSTGVHTKTELANSAVYRELLERRESL